MDKAHDYACLYLESFLIAAEIFLCSIRHVLQSTELMLLRIMPVRFAAPG
jgi:hypothetical protein